jgi:hypothetical protein
VTAAVRVRTRVQEFVGHLLTSEASVASVSAEQQHGFNHWLDELAAAADSALLGASSITNSPPAGESEHEHGTAVNTMPGPLLNTGRFNHVLELPRLIRWFADNTEPTKSKINEYMQILNQSPLRRHGEKVSTRTCNGAHT